MLRRLLLDRQLALGSLISNRRFNVTDASNPSSDLTLNEYHEASDNKLEELSERLEEALEEKYDQGADVSLNNGVLTVVIDNQNTFVINKQTPNKQIWLSSPISGPMRFDLVAGKWVNKQNNTELDSLISGEISRLLKK